MAIKALSKPTRRGRHNHAENLNKVLEQLKSNNLDEGVTLQHLVEVCGVSKRHIYRYLNELEQLGIEIERPKQYQGIKAGVGKYKLKELANEHFGEAALIVSIEGISQEIEDFQSQVIYIKKFLLLGLLARYGLSLPHNYLR
ncbi:HTH domain-containing protein [Desulforamulus aquiferis]|uniref:HTH domain-containing protein n=1 Tax=Desulforamulus aquiferis TaxID=1397668 RepID=A0AAW7ZCV0_9FIRM|nr:HTH domain-containing protein [Desulforamulus aquiferis]MDO7787074.1 HTH domain-containing protein [Desulforamulus aquiferis]RYD06606.1 hypothetical protein N752_02755 [Desulforamulus aquiferis]